jgi:hypothetical protein
MRKRGPTRAPCRSMSCSTELGAGGKWAGLRSSSFRNPSTAPQARRRVDLPEMPAEKFECNCKVVSWRTK